MIAFADPPGTTDGPSRKESRTVAELIRTVSASRLSTWSQCRLKFYFRYVSGIEKPPTPALHVGKVVHFVLQQWSLARWRGTPLDADAMNAVFENAWSVLPDGHEIVWEGEEEVTRANTFNLIGTYLLETPIPVDEKPAGVEVSMEVDLASHGLPTLIGIIDLVRPGGRIVDFKTTGRTPNPEMAQHTTETQTTGYALLYREATGHRESGIELHHLVKTKTPKIVVTEFGPATDGQVTRLLRLIDAYVDGLVREDFVPSPGLQCASCEFFSECRAWH